MNKMTKTKKQLSVKGLVIAAIITSLLMIISFCFVYWSATSPTPWENADCEGVSYTTSADGLVVVSEADLRCSGEAYMQREAHEKRDAIGKTAGIASSILNLIFLIFLLKSIRTS